MDMNHEHVQLYWSMHSFGRVDKLTCIQCGLYAWAQINTSGLPIMRIVYMCSRYPLSNKLVTQHTHIFNDSCDWSY